MPDPTRENQHGTKVLLGTLIYSFFGWFHPHIIYSFVYWILLGGQ